MCPHEETDSDSRVPRPPDKQRKSRMIEKDLIDKIEIVLHQIVKGGYQLPRPGVRFMKINRNIQRIIFRKNRGLRQVIREWRT